MSIMSVYLLLIFLMTDVFSLTEGQGLAPPTLTAHPSVITETDRVHLNCQPPPSVSVSRCYFYKTNLQILDNSSCLQSVRGSDLLTRKQNFPAQVELQCYYIVEEGQTLSTSSHSGIALVTVWSATEITLHTDKDKVVIIYSLPLYATDSKCNLYFGQFKQPYSTTNSIRNEKRLFCQFFVSEVDLVRNLSKVQRKVVSCDYSSRDGYSSLSHRTEYDLSVFMRKYYPGLTTASPDPVKTTDPHLKTKGSHPESPIWLPVTLSSCGFVMGSVLTILGFLFSKWIKGKRIARISQDFDPDSRTMDNMEIQNEVSYENVEAAGPYMPLTKASDVYATIQQPTETPTENINLSTV